VNETHAEILSLSKNEKIIDFNTHFLPVYDSCVSKGFFSNSEIKIEASL
jgi:hypothetical protein